MTATTQDVHIPDTIEITKDDDGQLIGICPTTDTDNSTNPKTSNPLKRHGLDNPETTLPTCCPRYPPGSTLLECRFEGDQPVANVVQVPGCANNHPKTCFLLETQASRSGPSSRVACYPQKDPIKSIQKHLSCEENDEAGKMSMAYTLESRECSDGPFARAMIIPSEESPVNSSNKVTSLHVCKGKNHPVHPTSKIMYGPRLDKWSRKARCENEEEAAVRESAPVSFIGCTASKKQATARITKCHTREDGAPSLGAKRCLETHVPRNSDRPTAVSFVCPLEKPTACHHSVMEARVDECGPRTRMVSYPHEDNFSGYMESRNVEDGPAARIMQQSLDTVNETSGYYVAEGGVAEEDEGRKLCRAPSGCATNCAKKSKQLQCEGRPAARQDVAEGGNDDNSRGAADEYLGMRRFPRGKMCPNYCCKQTVRPKSCTTKYEKDCRKPERRAQPPVCPPSAERPKTCTDAAQRGKRAEEGVKTYKFLLLPCTIVDKSRAAEDCTRPKEKRERLDCGEEKGREKVDECEEEEEIPKISSEELLTRYRDYFSPNTLHRYEVCRSKRNGLQDQCKLPIPRAVIELKMKELRSGRRKG